MPKSDNNCLSVIIPARNEPYLGKTTKDILLNASGDIEVIIVLDGYWPDETQIINDPKVKYIHYGDVVGMRSAINAAVAVAKGEYLLKTDAHCMFAKDYDVALKHDIEDNWVVVPRRKRLDPDKWEITEKNKPDVDYMILDHEYRGRIINRKTKNNPAPLIDDLMTFQGSCWFMKKSYFHELGLLDTEHYGGSGHEAQEISLKCWFSGGRVVRNKKTWYAHWHKDKRGFSLDRNEVDKSREHMSKWIVEHKDDYIKLQNKFSGRTQKTEMLDLDKFAVGKPPFKVPYFTRDDLIKYFNLFGFKKGAEIGVRRGAFSETMCKEIEGLELKSIDPWEPIYEDHRGHKVSLKRHNRYYDIAKKRLGKYPGCEMIKTTSSEAVKNIPYESLDFVYIDGSHEFDYVMVDIIEWARRVRKGGIVSGHDYFKFRRWGDVVPAVNIYTKLHGIEKWWITDDKSPSFFWFRA